MDLALIVDVGTTNIKAGVVDKTGKVLTQESRNSDLKRPEKGALEHSPEELMENMVDLIKNVSADYGDDISVITFSGYQFGFMPMDKNNEPLTGMITLLDTRSKSIMPQLEEELPFDKIYEKTGCPPLFTYILSRIKWLQKDKPEILEKTKWFADIKSFLIQKLCGKPYTDPSIASVTQLYNIQKKDWDQELLDMIGIDRGQLPEVVSGDQIVDTISAEMAEKLNLSKDVAILPGVYDGGAMIIGMGGYDEKVGVCNLGTTAMFRSCSPDPLIDDPSQKRMQTYVLTSDRYATGGAMNNAGVMLRWFRDNLSGDKDYPEITAAAEEIEPGSDGVFCFPFLTGERDPRIGNMASASFFGMKEYHTFGHMSRALPEGIAYSLNLIKEVLQENEVTVDEIVVGGSGSKDDLWCQIMADVFNIKTVRSVTRDSTLVGGAILAFTALGEYKDINEASQEIVEKGKEFVPKEENVEIYEKGYSFFKKMLDKYTDLYDLHSQYFQ
ncbi:MAG: gluconokinase [Halanaerobiaceae bacterium]